MKKIKATHLRNWTRSTHPNCKFYPGDTATPIVCDTKFQEKFMSKKGKIIAVSCAPDGRIRGESRSGRLRYFTRYYLRFPKSDEIAYFSSDQLV